MMDSVVITPTTLSLILLFIMVGKGDCLRFDLESGHSKCISEDIKNDLMTVAKYNVVNPNDGHPIPDEYKISLKVTSPHGNNYHNLNNVESGNFAFVAAESGDYTMCFYAPDHRPPRIIGIDLVWETGVATKDWPSVVKKGNVEMMVAEFKRLTNIVSTIHDEMFYLREREEEMQDLNRSTNSKMATFGFMSLLICISVVALQLWHLKTFFERKKLLYTYKSIPCAFNLYTL